VCPSLPFTPALLDDAVALFERALNMDRTTDKTNREVKYRSDRLPDELKALVRQRRRLIHVAVLPQSTEDKLALNQLHRCTKKKLMAHLNNKFETKMHYISKPGNSNRSSSFWKYIKKIKIRALAPLPPLLERIIVTKSDDKATFFANLLATQNVPAAPQTANDALPQVSLPLPMASTRC
jgi:hypothetical protein